METSDKYTVSITFDYQGGEHGQDYLFSVYPKYVLPDSNDADNKDVYSKNELLVEGNLQPLLSQIANIPKVFHLRNLKVVCNEKVVFDKKEFDVVHTPTMDVTNN